jgi:hypothetical protein
MKPLEATFNPFAISRTFQKSRAPSPHPECQAARRGCGCARHSHPHSESCWPGCGLERHLHPRSPQPHPPPSPWALNAAGHICPFRLNSSGIHSCLLLLGVEDCLIPEALLYLLLSSAPSEQFMLPCRSLRALSLSLSLSLSLCVCVCVCTGD